MNKKFIAILFALSYMNLNAQQPCNCPTPPKYHERHSRNEVGISAGALYSPDHKEWGQTAHIHYFRTISYYSHWSLGGSVEQAWLDGSHWTFAAGAKFQPFDHFSLSVLPGIKLFSDNNTKTLFSLHFEAVYDLFHWDKFHLGPAIDYAWAKNHTHFMLGIHGAFSF